MSSALPKLNKNPFAQPEALWQLTFRAPMESAFALSEAFEEEALSTATFEDPSAPHIWLVHALFDRAPEESALKEKIATLAAQFETVITDYTVTAVQQEDWQRSLAQDFPPLSIGRFFVHGAHVKHLKPRHMKGLQVEAGMAFGSGEHATTSGCLLAIHLLAKRRKFRNILDMGCGSAILAVGAERCWPRAPILAVDIDVVSVRVSNENIALNAARKTVRALVGDGYAAASVKRRAPYDLILANILARPLVKFSHALAKNLAPGGVAVLSGLLATQEDMVLAAHRRQGLKLVRRIVKDGWSTLVLSK